LEGGDFFATTYPSGLSAVAAIIQHVKPNKIWIAKREGYFGSHDVINIHKHYIGMLIEIYILE
jgi:hypothetical protein